MTDDIDLTDEDEEILDSVWDSLADEDLDPAPDLFYKWPVDPPADSPDPEAPS